MFRIYRYFAIASAMAILAAMVVVGLLHRNHATEDMVAMAEGHNVALAQLLSNALWSRYPTYLNETAGRAGDSLRADPITAKIDGLIRELTEGLSILKVKVYNTDWLTVYSSEHAQIGDDHSTTAAYMAAAQEGRTASKLSHRGRISAFSGEVFGRDVIETYVPFRINGGAIVGVFEIYSDVTRTKDSIDRAVISEIIALAAIFLVLYGILVLLVMRRAMAPLSIASDRAAAIGPRSSGIRLPTEGMPAEVLTLIQATNGALDRLDTALDGHRRFTADAAHELLTPLAVLRANLDTLTDGEVAAKIRPDVEAISDIVNQLLELAELEALAPEEREAVDARDVCVEVVSKLAPIAIKQGKEIALTGVETAVLVRGCRKGLVSAVGNLIRNAMAHAPDGTPVEVNFDGDGAIRVIDKGSGVPPADRERIFERFWRGRKNAAPGSGLGLAIVRRLVVAVDGSVSVTDAPGGGAVFTLRLPKADEDGRA